MNFQKEDLFKDKFNLFLIHPRVHGKKLTSTYIQSLQHQNSCIVNIQKVQNEVGEIDHIVLSFDSMTDVTDFQIENSHTIKTSQIFLKQGVSIYEFLQSSKFASEKVNEIEEDGFLLQEGKIKLLRKTSIEDELSEKSNEDNSTIVQTQIFLPHADDSKKLEIEEESQIFEIEEKGLEKKQIFLTFMSTAIFTGLIYGGTKLLNFLV